VPAWHWNAIRATRSWLPTLLTLTFLGGLAWWGWQNHWQLPSWHSSGGEPKAADGKSSEAKGSAIASVDSGRIELASAEVARHAGLGYAPVQVRPMVQYVTALGAVDYEPSRYARLSSRASGSVWRVDKEIGAPVRKGEALAFIEAAEVGKFKASFLQSLTQLRQNETVLKRLQSLGQQGAVSERSQLDAAFALKEARIRVFHDQQALLNLGLPIRLEEVKDLPDEQLVQHLRVLGLPKGLLQQFDPKTLTANLLPLTAPFDGTVVQRNVGPGEVVQAVETKQGTESRPLFIIADLTHLHVDLDVHPADMALVRVGQKVLFRPDGPEAKTVAARVSHISPEVNEKTRRVLVHAEVDNTDGKLRPNTFGTGQIVVGEQPRALVVPSEALQKDGDKDLVFVKESATSFARRSVKTGLREGNWVEVSGVQVGEQVVTKGSFVLKSELLKDRIASGD